MCRKSGKRHKMKALLYSAMMAAAPLAVADISLGNGETTTATDESTAAEAQQYVQMANEVLSVVKELTAQLKNVTDQATADAAAPQISGISARMIELQKKAENMPRPNAAVELMVRNAINVQEVQQVVSEFLNSFIRISMSNAYGSQALLNALGPVINAMPGGQE